MPDRGIKPYCTYNVLNTQRFATDLWFFRLNLCWIWDQIGWISLDGIIHLPCMIRAFSRAFTKGSKSPIGFLVFKNPEYSHAIIRNYAKPILMIKRSKNFLISASSLSNIYGAWYLWSDQIYLKLCVYKIIPQNDPSVDAIELTSWLSWIFTAYYHIF